MRVGEVYTLEHTYTHEDVQRFTALSGDQGAHHVQPDDAGRIMVHGLFVAMLPTQLGGQLHYVAREMTFEFVRPVFTGDTVTCELHITGVEQREHNTRITADAVCLNQDGEEVMRGKTHGQIPKVTP